MSSRRWGVLLGSAVISATMLVPASAAGRETVAAPAASGAVRVTGTIRYVQPSNLHHPDGASAEWAVDGAALLLLQEAPLVGITNTAGLSNSDERYAHALLTGFAAVVPPTPCGDGTDATTTVDYPGISDPSAAIALGFMEVNRYTGSGSIHVNVAESPVREDEMLAPGQVTVHRHSDCYGSSTDDTSVVPVMGEATGDEPLGGYWAYQDIFMGRWKLKLASGGAWVIHQHRVLSSTSYDSADETIDLAISGSLTTLKADCALPSVRRLHPANSFSAADAIVVRGGFTHLRHLEKFSRAAPKGHFFVLEGVGNKYAACGQHVHVVKSLGWPS